ncbi:DALR anticodon binding domain-containing protein [Balamuthia mandrillaris]
MLGAAAANRNIVVLRGACSSPLPPPVPKAAATGTTPLLPATPLLFLGRRRSCVANPRSSRGLWFVHGCSSMWSNLRRYSANQPPLRHTAACNQGQRITLFEDEHGKRRLGPQFLLQDLFEEAVLKTFPTEQVAFDKTMTVTQAPPTKSKADYQFTGTFAIGKALKQPPTQIANQLMQSLERDRHGARDDKESHTIAMIDKIEVVKGGFITVTLRPHWLYRQVEQILQTERAGTTYQTTQTNHATAPHQLQQQQARRPRKKVLVDFASPNMAKDLHVGHLRSIIQGNALANLLELYSGHHVERISHVGDFGYPMGIVLAMVFEVEDKTGHSSVASLNAAQLSALYAEGKQRTEADPEFCKLAHALARELQQGERASPRVWNTFNRICEASRASFEDIYRRLEVTVQERGESFYRDMLPGIVKELMDKGIAVENEGAKCVFFKPSESSSELLAQQTNLPPFIIEKNDGAHLYSTTDLAALKHRIHQLNCDWIIYVTDHAQSLHFQMVLETARLAGWYDPAVTRVDHVTFGVVQGEDGKRLRSRDGTPFSLSKLMDDGIEEATSVVRTTLSLMKAEARQSGALPQVSNRLTQKQPENITTTTLPITSHTTPSTTINPEEEQEIHEIAEKLAYAAIKYFELSHHRSSDYIFSFPRMLSFKGNTAVYMMYAFTRIQSIRRQVSLGLDHRLLLPSQPTQQGSGHEIDMRSPYQEKEARDLAVALLQFSDVMQTVEDRLQLHLLCEYLYRLSTKFHQFYERCHILHCQDQSKKQEWLLLCFAVEKVLEQAMTILGITPVRKM